MDGSVLWSWVCKNHYFSRTTSERIRRDTKGVAVNSHNSLSGGVLRVPLDAQDEFHSLYVDDVSSGTTHYLSENFTATYRMCFDLDLEAEDIQPEGRRKVKEEDDHDSFKARCAAFMEIISTVRRFYPADSPASNFVCAVCECKRKVLPAEDALIVDRGDGLFETKTKAKPQRVKYGVHLVFPYLFVDKVKAVAMCGAVAARLEEKLGKREDLDIWANPWHDVVDVGIHERGTLRMVYSDKPKGCLECKALDKRENVDTGKDKKTKSKKKKDSLCENPLCSKRQIPQGRPYLPKLVLELDGTANPKMLKEMTKNKHLAVSLLTIRSYISKSTEGFSIFEGCAPAVYAHFNPKPLKKGEIDHAQPIFKGDADGLSKIRKKKNYLQYDDPRCRLMVEMARDIDTVYSDISFHAAFYIKATSKLKIKGIDPTSDKGKQIECYILNVKGSGSKYCMNKRGDHSSNTIYFVFTRGGLRQKCFCSKTDLRVTGKACADYASELYPLPRDKNRVLFPDIITEFTIKDIALKKKRKGTSFDNWVGNGMRRPVELLQADATQAKFEANTAKFDSRAAAAAEAIKKSQRLEEAKKVAEGYFNKGSNKRKNDIEDSNAKLDLPTVKERLTMTPLEMAKLRMAMTSN